MIERESVEFYTGDRDDPEPIPRARPDQKFTGGMRPEDILGLCAEEIDDEFIEVVLSLRRDCRAKEPQS